MPVELSARRLHELAALACAGPRPLPKRLKLERLRVHPGGTAYTGSAAGGRAHKGRGGK